eukprot:TRINITY_DN16786_c0_g3_i1.p1 TRINITY_DN16786_c0_g3~~TRINITY_DN16786_c0_g3_i1.p1  ORF type:complete len:635 (-),score=171.35 TRINITY_DN16786_c0_g3_i1:81-1985(-)
MRHQASLNGGASAAWKSPLRSSLNSGDCDGFSGAPLGVYHTFAEQLQTLQRAVDCLQSHVLPTMLPRTQDAEAEASCKSSCRSAADSAPGPGLALPCALNGEGEEEEGLPVPPQAPWPQRPSQEPSPPKSPLPSAVPPLEPLPPAEPAAFVKHRRHQQLQPRTLKERIKRNVSEALARRAGKDDGGLAAIGDSEEGSTDRPHQGGKPIFADKEALKEKVRESVLRPAYSVCDLYHESGIFQSIARHQIFENVTLTVIFVNALWISVEMDYNEAEMLNDSPAFFQIVEHLFCAYFAFEWFVRFMAFKIKTSALRDGWMVFDSCLAFMMVAETWVLSICVLFMSGSMSKGFGDTSILRIARNFRLTRAARVARLLRVVPELLVLIKGMAIGFRAVFFSILLLAMFIYLFAIFFAQLAKGTPLEQTHFTSVQDSMYVLLLGGILADQEGLMSDLGRQHALYVALFLVYFLIVVLTLLNMLLGVLVDVVNVVAAVEKEKNNMLEVKTRLMNIFGLEKGEEDVSISHADYNFMLLDPTSAKDLDEVGIDTLCLVDIAEYVFAHTQELPFSELLSIMLNLRGAEPARKADLNELKKFMQKEFLRLRDAPQQPQQPQQQQQQEQQRKPTFRRQETQEATRR